MTGWNLPPGVNVNDIPGNRPEDVEEEEFWDALDKQFQKDYPYQWATIRKIFESDEYDDAIIDYIRVARDIAFNAGYNAGQADEAMYRGLTEEDS
jgi:hypothetical protein